MEIKDLEGRIYFLAGQLEEAKKVYQYAMGEIERAKQQAIVNKEQANRESNKQATSNPIEILERQPNVQIPTGSEAVPA